jgi:hypothetical protein
VPLCKALHKGTLLTSSLPDSRHSLCISERQLRSGRNFASTPGFYALIREIFEGVTARRWCKHDRAPNHGYCCLEWTTLITSTVASSSIKITM